MLTLAQALAWRMRQHALLDEEASSIADVATRVVAFRAWPARLTEMTASVRLPDGVAAHDTVASALACGDVICSYALRGGAYIFTHEVAAAILAVRTTTRVWETARYQQQGHFSIDDWEPLRAVVRDALSNGPKTRAELRAHITSMPALRHLDIGTTGKGSDSLYKPLHWWGDICFGPPRDGESTFRLLDDPQWQPMTDIDAAGHLALTHYLASYAPATIDNLRYWFTEGLSVPRRRLLQWLDDLQGTVSVVDINGSANYVLTRDLDAMLATPPTDSMRLLPGYDPWILGPGTADTRMLAPEHRHLATRGANLVIRGGIVCGTWQGRGTNVSVELFRQSEPFAESALLHQVQRITPSTFEAPAVSITYI